MTLRVRIQPSDPAKPKYKDSSASFYNVFSLCAGMVDRAPSGIPCSSRSFGNLWERPTSVTLRFKFGSLGANP